MVNLYSIIFHLYALCVLGIACALHCASQDVSVSKYFDHAMLLELAKHEADAAGQMEM